MPNLHVRGREILLVSSKGNDGWKNYSGNAEICLVEMMIELGAGMHTNQSSLDQDQRENQCHVKSIC